jgi:hypothetical protein
MAPPHKVERQLSLGTNIVKDYSYYKNKGASEEEEIVNEKVEAFRNKLLNH